MASRFLPTFRRGVGAEESAAPPMETKDLADRVRSSSRYYSVPGQPYSPDWNVARAVQEGFQGNPWIFRSVEVICYTALNQQIVLRQGDGVTGTPLAARRDTSRLLYRLNKRANPWETAKLWRYRLLAQWLLSSKGLFVEVARNNSGGYALLHLLDPDLTDPIPSKTSPIGSFQMRTTVGDSGRIYNELPPFDPDSSASNSVLWIRSPHPTIMHRGMSPMEAAGLSIDLDRYARLYNRNYMQSGGRPDGILAIKGIAEWDTIERLEAKFNDTSSQGKTTAIQADAMDYKDLSTAPRDMQWSEVMDRMKREATMVFGVPESMMGDASGRTFDNADAEYAIFWEHRMGPLLALLDDQLDVLTPGGFDDELYLRHDTSDVWVLSRHKRAEQDRAAADLGRGAITIDDYRERIGLERLDVPAT
ncbi:MAG: phage portal protein, partial [Pseudonocardia sp.]|nr:phage portal protein [Pseudonocardia sp.]